MVVGTPFHVKSVTVLVFAHIVSAQVFAGKLAPVGDGEGAFVPPEGDAALEGCQLVAPAVAGCALVGKAQEEIGSETVDVVETHCQDILKQAGVSGIDRLRQEAAVSHI